MRKFGLLCLMILALGVSAMAQETASVAGTITPTPAVQATVQPEQTRPVGDYPNLGRYAKPLSTLVLTPPPLPPISIELDTTRAPEKPKVEVSKSAVPQTKTESRPILVDEGIKPTPPPIQLKPVPKPVVPAVKEPKMPPTLEDLFGKTADVKRFNVGGFMLGMTPETVLEVAGKLGWRVAKINRRMPLFHESYFEEKCRAAGVRIVSDINACIQKGAISAGIYYISEIQLEKKSTREALSILFSTYATDNQAYKVFYQSLGDNSLGFSPKAMATKIRRKDMFWNEVFASYGYPDDADLILWGDLQGAYMQATMAGANYDAYLALEDKTLQDKDYFATEDAARALQYKNPFTFAAKPEAEEW